MTAKEVKRKLAAILSADVKGYSRLMGEDEEVTLRTLNAYKEVMGSLIQQHRGRVVGTAGDSVLAEFGSVVDAVQCAVEIQQVLRAKNAVVPENRRMEFRIGINLGDVIEEGEQIYGDGVNIAARLEGLAEAGGICISESAYQQIENKLPLRYDYLGEHEVKNIAKPVRVYCARIEADAGPSKLGKEKKAAQKRLSKAALAIIGVVVIVGAVALYQFVLRPSPSKTEVASKEKMVFPLPDVPSIAVLPFVNMSEDPKQEFLCDGMTEAIITALSKVPRMFVIARNSTFAYKGKPVKVKQVSEDLGVRYVLEGSLQRSGDRLRITAQLIDALTGNHLWAERYDRDLKDIFALQDEITIKILTGVHVKLAGGDVSRAERFAEKYYKGKQGLDCYLKLMEAESYYARWNIQDNNIARRIIEEAIAMCPENPMGYIHLGFVYHHDHALGNTKSPQETLEKGIELAQKALAMDESIASAHSLLCGLYRRMREYEKSIAEGERAVALDPGGAGVLTYYAVSLGAVGRPEESIPLFQKAIRLDPFSSPYRSFGDALREAGRFEEAASALKKAIQLAPDDIRAHYYLAATYIMMGREKEARAEAAEVLRIDPKFSLDFLAKILPYKDQSRRDKVINALRKAGLK
jgi:adenylate cyclase